MGTRLFFASIICCAVLTTATGTSTPLLVDVGDVAQFNIHTWGYPVFNCFLETPKNEIINFNDSTSSSSSSPSSSNKYILKLEQFICSASVLITDVNDNGLWKIYLKTPDGEREENMYTVIINSPNHPELRDIEILPEAHIRAYKGAVQTVKINAFDHVETCHIKSNEGQEYQMPGLPDVADIEWINEPSIACGVRIKLDENAIGNWTLFSRGKRHSRYIEQRLPFTVNVEEIVEATPRQILIATSRDIVVRLEQSAGILQNTCELVPPEGLDISKVSYSRQETSANFCEYKIKQVSNMHAGVWHIQYGNSITYKAPIDVFVYDENITVEPHVEWPRNRVVDMNIGPENAIYCKVEDPLGRVVQEKFYRCHIYLNRPEEHHAGLWTLTVGMPGKIVAKVFKVKVTLTSAVARPEVITKVQREATQVLLSCGLSVSGVSVRNCKFLSPSGKLLLPTLGVGEDGYSFHQPDILLDSNVTASGCGLRITNATNSDLGIWRCTIENENYEPYYGFLNLHSVNSNEITVKEEPNLIAYPNRLTLMEGTADTIMSCTIPSSIRYCYFRDFNGTIYNIIPGVITDQLEYKGLGFEAGDCTVNFKNLQMSHAGVWSCHVGLTDPKMEERTTQLLVRVQRPYNVMHDIVYDALTLQFYNYKTPLPIEYCRFVRSDGIGFTIDNVPGFYEKIDDRKFGTCGIFIQNTNLVERQNWTLAVKLEGDEREISLTSMPRVIQRPTTKSGSTWVIWMCALMMTFILVMFALLITSKDTKMKAGVFIRNSFRRNNKKQQENNIAAQHHNNNHSYA